jgi:hypothetical protein
MRSSTVLEISAVLSSCNQKNEHFLLKAKYYVQERKKRKLSYTSFFHACHSSSVEIVAKMQEPLGTGFWRQTEEGFCNADDIPSLSLSLSPWRNFSLMMRILLPFVCLSV